MTSQKKLSLVDLMTARAAAAPAGEFTPLPQVEGRTYCLTCGGGSDKSDGNFLVAMGFGSAGVTANGTHIIEEQEWVESDEFDGAEVTLELVERVARTRPDADWRIHMFGPLSEQEYQRQGEGRWVLVHQGEGFV